MWRKSNDGWNVNIPLAKLPVQLNLIRRQTRIQINTTNTNHSSTNSEKSLNLCDSRQQQAIVIIVKNSQFYFGSTVILFNLSIERFNLRLYEGNGFFPAGLLLFIKMCPLLRSTCSIVACFFLSILIFLLPEFGERCFNAVNCTSTYIVSCHAMPIHTLNVAKR